MDQDNRNDIPSFELPDWGMDGAPPAPTEDLPEIEEGPEVTLEVDHALLMITGHPLHDWTVDQVYGLVSGEGVSEKSDPERRASAASKRALSALEFAARGMGANAICDVRLALATRKSRTSIVAYGTAMRIRRTGVN